MSKLLEECTEFENEPLSSTFGPSGVTCSVVDSGGDVDRSELLQIRYRSTTEHREKRYI